MLKFLFISFSFIILNEDIKLEILNFKVVPKTWFHVIS